MSAYFICAALVNTYVFVFPIQPAVVTDAVVTSIPSAVPAFIGSAGSSIVVTAACNYAHTCTQ